MTDPSTGLTWQRAVYPTAFNYQHAAAYCPALVLAGGGWRLPTRDELASLVASTRSDPAIDPVAFPNTPAESFWTSTPDTSPNIVAARQWTIRFSSAGAPISYDQNWKLHVRCVRSTGPGSAPDLGCAGSSSSTCVSNLDGTVTDTTTGLIWQRNLVVAPAPVIPGCSRSSGVDWCTQAQAFAYCDGLKLAGASDWRLPSARELESLPDLSKTPPLIDLKAFPDTLGVYFMTSSNDLTSAAMVSFHDGRTWYGEQTTATAAVRCVR